MRGLRWILLLAIAVILAAVGSSYYIQKVRQAREAPPPPIELPPNVTASSELWRHTEYEGGRPIVEIRAHKMRQIREPSEFELEGVELRIFQEAGYDRVRSAHANYDIASNSLYSEGDVEITLDVPGEEGADESGLMVIESSGVQFDTELGTATTERPTRFRFPRGRGQSVGATYDPGWGDLRMHNDVRIEWFGENPGEETMIVEAGELVYKEDHSKVYLSPWSRFRRGTLTMEAGNSVVELEDGVIQRVDAEHARGNNTDDRRSVDYEADLLKLEFKPDVTMERINGEGNAKLVSRTETSETEVTANKLFLEFRAGGTENELDNALALGNGRLQSRSLGDTTPVRVLKSEAIKTILRPGGEEIELIETHEPGTVEFLPNGPGQRYRRLDAFRIKMIYGAQNQLDEFQAINVETRTEGIASNGGDKAPPVKTWSDGLLARFDAGGAVDRLEQWGDFRYEEGEQKAKADRAVFHLPQQLVHLTDNARVWNLEGSTAASRITLDEEQGRVTAQGNVSSTRLPEKRLQEAPSNGILTGGQTIHATAKSMLANSDGSFISYEGDVVMWQGADRLKAERVEINREHGTLKAFEDVRTQFPSQRAAGDDSEVAVADSFTAVSAEELIYLEEHNLAHYKGGVHLVQPGLDLTSHELKAFFQPAGASGAGTLDRAIAEGRVRIRQKGSKGRKLDGISERAEYYLTDERLVLTGGRPKMIDSERGTTQGSRLTYFARNDRLQVDGAENRPAVSSFRQR